MPNRILRDWTTSESVDQLSEGAEVLFTRLIMKADDYGSYYGNPKLINSALFPLKDHSVGHIENLIRECVDANLIKRYVVDGKPFIRINNFGQRLRNMRSNFPHEGDVPQPKARKAPASRSKARLESNRIEVETESETKTKPLAASKLATLAERQQTFMDKVSLHLPQYSKEMCREFYDYWTEMNDGGKKMRFEMQRVFQVDKRLRTWFNRTKTDGYTTKQAASKFVGESIGISKEQTLERLNSYTD